MPRKVLTDKQKATVLRRRIRELKREVDAQAELLIQNDYDLELRRSEAKVYRGRIHELEETINRLRGII